MSLKQSALRVERIFLRGVELEGYGFYALVLSTLMFTFIHVYAYLSVKTLPVVVDVIITAFISIAYLHGVFYSVFITRKTFQDYLTGVYNREFFITQLQILEKEGSGFHLVNVDIHKFKSVNDLLGHRVGDALLIEVAKRLKASVGDHDIVARIGSNEFGIILPSPLCDETLTKILKKISTSAAVPFFYEGNEIDVKYSIGVATFPKDGVSLDDLMRKADSAMYISKKQNLEYYIFNPATYNSPEVEAQLIVDLKHALNNDEITVVYQPKYSFADNKATACEALARWHHPRMGAIPPSKFVRLAEQECLIDQLLRNMLKRVFIDMESWSNMGLEPSVGINVSADNLCNMDIITEIMSGAKKHGLDLNRIMLEVTETAIMKDPEEAIKYLVMLNSIGVRLSLDDFGTGNSSFVYLKHLPISEIKIDRTFTQDMMKTGNDLMIIEATIHLAKSCGISVVAEGVDTVEQFEKLRDEGCDVIQGYYISKPLQYNDFVQFINGRSQ